MNREYDGTDARRCRVGPVVRSLCDGSEDVADIKGGEVWCGLEELTLYNAEGYDIRGKMRKSTPDPPEPEVSMP